MFKKMIALTLIFAMLVPFSSAAAADEPSATPTVEEILSEYHRKAFEAQAQGDTESSSTWSRRSGDGKTLEQETVDTLTEAGYEAYNVTADNYETLEDELKTDFAAMGLDPEGSYIVAISGEEPSTHTNSNARNGGNFDQVTEDFGSGAFEYTQDGTTYQMRYFTVTAFDNAQFGQTSEVDLLSEIGADEVLDALELPLSIISLLPGFDTVEHTYSLLSLISPDVENTQPSSLEYRGGTTWTVTYLEIYNPVTSTWRARSSVESVTLRYFIHYTYVDPTTKQFEQTSTNGTHGIRYSQHYGDLDWMKTNAVLAYNYAPRSCMRDTVEQVEYRYNGETVITHQRMLDYIEDRP